MALVKREGNIIQQSREVAKNLATKNYSHLKESDITKHGDRVHGVQSEVIRTEMNIKHLQDLQKLAEVKGKENVEKIKLVKTVVEAHTGMVQEEHHLQQSAQNYADTRMRLARERTMNARNGLMSAAR